MKKSKFKNERGSITLFVLLSILFFLIVIFSVFIASSNKEQSQTSEVDKIKQEYEKSVDNIDQIYNETLTENLSNILKVGDYVNYTYDTVSQGYSLPSTESGYDTNQTIAQTTGLKWRILNIDEDGTVDLVSEKVTSQPVYLNGALGYNNGVLLLNDICAEQYSNKNLGITARSINLEDIESQMNENGITYRNSFVPPDGITQYGKTETYQIDNNQYPQLYDKENGSGINTTTIKNNGINSSDNGYSSITSETSNIAENGLTVTQSFYVMWNPSTYFEEKIYSILFETNNYYWLSSRFVGCVSYRSYFGLHSINNSNLTGNYLFYSDGSTSVSSNFTRPVVTVNLNQILPCTGITADGDDKTIEHMHQIKGIYEAN